MVVGNQNARTVRHGHTLSQNLRIVVWRETRSALTSFKVPFGDGGAAQAHSRPKECGLASDPFFRIEVSQVIIPLTSRANSVSGVMNREKPQSKQTKTFGNTRTPGMARF